MKMTILFLTCANAKEANNISKTLLEKRLIACARKIPVSSSFWWKGKVDRADEAMLMMESVEEKFGEIETEVKKLHSYETFVLTTIPVGRSSSGVQEWLKESLK
jgi:periplasmic divalent cation tolerance protein